MIYSIIAYVVVLVLLGVWGILCLRQEGWRKWVGVIGYAVICVASFICFLQSLGNAIPVWALVHKSEMDVLDIYQEEDKAIYIWGFMEGDREPKVVVLPWSDKMSEQFLLEQMVGQMQFGSYKLIWKDSEGDQIDQETTDEPILKFIPRVPILKESD